MLATGVSREDPKLIKVIEKYQELEHKYLKWSKEARNKDLPKDKRWTMVGK